MITMSIAAPTGTIEYLFTSEEVNRDAHTWFLIGFYESWPEASSTPQGTADIQVTIQNTEGGIVLRAGFLEEERETNGHVGVVWVDLSADQEIEPPDECAWPGHYDA